MEKNKNINVIKDLNGKDDIFHAFSDNKILEDYHKLSKGQQVRLLKYMKRLGKMNGGK